MIRQNLHTHSVYCDGKDTIDEMAQTAIEKGFTILGFSGHGPCRYDEIAMTDEKVKHYLADIAAAKEKYAGKIEIFAGIEEDMAQRIPSKDPFDFVIGSKHFMEFEDRVLNVDYSEEMAWDIMKIYEGDFLAYARDYYKGVAEIAGFEEVDIIGHLDLLTKYNEDESFGSFTNPRYIQLACDCIDTVIAHDKILEVNTGAIARGYRKTPYPEKHLLAYIKEKGGKIMLNSDCHNRFMLDCAFDASMELIRSCGFTSMMILTEEGFKEAPIGEFAD